MSHDHTRAYELSFDYSAVAIDRHRGTGARIDRLWWRTCSRRNDSSSVLLTRPNALAERGADGLKRRAEHSADLGGSLSRVGSVQGRRHEWLRPRDRDTQGV